MFLFAVSGCASDSPTEPSVAAETGDITVEIAADPGETVHVVRQTFDGRLRGRVDGAHGDVLTLTIESGDMITLIDPTAGAGLALSDLVTISDVRPGDTVRFNACDTCFEFDPTIYTVRLTGGHPAWADGVVVHSCGGATPLFGFERQFEVSGACSTESGEFSLLFEGLVLDEPVAFATLTGKTFTAGVVNDVDFSELVWNQDVRSFDYRVATPPEGFTASVFAALHAPEAGGGDIFASQYLLNSWEPFAAEHRVAYAPGMASRITLRTAYQLPGTMQSRGRAVGPFDVSHTESLPLDGSSLSSRFDPGVPFPDLDALAYDAAVPSRPVLEWTYTEAAFAPDRIDLFLSWTSTSTEGIASRRAILYGPPGRTRLRWPELPQDLRTYAPPVPTPSNGFSAMVSLREWSRWSEYRQTLPNVLITPEGAAAGDAVQGPETSIIASAQFPGPQ